MMPILLGEFNGKQLSVSNIIVCFCRGEVVREEGARMELIILTGVLG